VSNHTSSLGTGEPLSLRFTNAVSRCVAPTVYVASRGLISIVFCNCNIRRCSFSVSVRLKVSCCRCLHYNVHFRIHSNDVPQLTAAVIARPRSIPSSVFMCDMTFLVHCFRCLFVFVDYENDRAVRFCDLTAVVSASPGVRGVSR